MHILQNHNYVALWADIETMGKLLVVCAPSCFLLAIKLGNFDAVRRPHFAFFKFFDYLIEITINFVFILSHIRNLSRRPVALFPLQ